MKNLITTLLTTTLVLMTSAVFSQGPCNGETTLSYNDTIYNLVEIDDRCWFAEDLRTLFDRNDVSIKLIVDSSVWVNTRVPAITHLENTGEFYKSYNWYAVNTRLLCPTGWHVADNNDWNSLEATVFGLRENRLNGQSKTMSVNSTDLYDLGFFSNYTTSNIFESPGFSAGLKEGIDGRWRNDQSVIYWWTADEYNLKSNENNRNKSAWSRGLSSNGTWGRYRDLWSTSNSKKNALRVRCVKDVTPEIDLLFFFAPGPITLSESDRDANINAQDTVYVDTLGTTLSEGYVFDNARGDRFITDRSGVLTPIGNYRLNSNQEIITIHNFEDDIDYEIGAGPQLQTCVCCCTAGSNSFISSFTVATRSCSKFCDTQENCTALQLGNPDQGQCWDEIFGIASDYTDGYLNKGWNVKQQETFSLMLRSIGVRASEDLGVGVQIAPFAIAEYSTGIRNTTLDDFRFMKGLVFSMEDRWYRINDSWVIEGGGSDPLPEWGGGSDPKNVNVCKCFTEAPICEGFYRFDERTRLHCTKICYPYSTTHPGSPPCDYPQ